MPWHCARSAVGPWALTRRPSPRPQVEVTDNDLAAVHYSPLTLSIDELSPEAVGREGLETGISLALFPPHPVKLAPLPQWSEAARASPGEHAIEFWLASSPVSGEAVAVTIKSPDSNKLKLGACRGVDPSPECMKGIPVLSFASGAFRTPQRVLVWAPSDGVVRTVGLITHSHWDYITHSHWDFITHSLWELGAVLL